MKIFFFLSIKNTLFLTSNTCAIFIGTNGIMLISNNGGVRKLNFPVEINGEDPVILISKWIEALNPINSTFKGTIAEIPVLIHAKTCGGASLRVMVDERARKENVASPT